MSDLALRNREEVKKRRTLITPEGVDLSLKLADVSQRAAAFLVDLVIMVVILIAMTFLAASIAYSLGSENAEIALVIWLLGFFLLRNGYFILMEMGPRAATFGKRGAGLRVVARSGERLTADRVIARNLMREIEFFLPLSFLFYNAAEGSGEGLFALAGLLWTAIFLFFPAFNKDKMRIGDLLAGTWVISVPKKKLTFELLGAEGPNGAYRFTDAQLDVYGVFELQTLERVLREGQAEAIGTVSQTIRAKIGYHDLPGHDYDFLHAYYEASRARMERGLLFGKRRADKFDR